MLVALTVVWRAWTLSRWTWDFDDWVYMADTRSMSFPDYLFQDYNGHLMPAEFLVSWLVTHGAPLNFAVPVVLVSLGSGLATWVWSRALAEVAGGPRAVLLLPLALLALSPLMIRTTMWWASALQVVPLQVFMGLCVLAAARLAATGSWRDFGLLLLSIAGGLLFWEKAVLLLIPATGVLLHATPGSLVAKVRRRIVPVAVLVGLAAAYTVTYLAMTGGSDEETGPVLDFRAGRSPGTVVDFFWRGVSELLAPALLGGPWGTMPLPANPFIRPPGAVAWGSAAVAALVLLSLVRRHRDTWLPVTMGAAYTVVTIALVLYSRRFDVLGVSAVNDERYVVDTFAVAVLAGAMVASGPARRGPRRPLRRAVVPVLAAALAASLVAGNVWAVARVGTHPGKPWVDNLTVDVERRAPVTLLDAYAPERVLPASFWADDARLSRMLAPLAPDVSFDGPADQLWAVDDDGHLREVAVEASTSSRSGPVPDCGYALDAGETVQVPMRQELFALDWVVQVDTLAAQGGPVTITLDDGSYTFTAGAGLGQHQFAYRGGVSGSVGLSLSPDAGTTCITDVVVGTASIGSD